jgi:LmbE family N-acetylglucosaminyl deacetylase
MRMSWQEERVLAVVAHPDDAELLCAGTLLRARDDGAAAAVCVLCQGDKGQPAHRRVENLAVVRRAEMQSAVDVAGLELFPVGIGDSELKDDEPTRRLVVEIMRRFRPTLILAHAGNDYHVDHRTASQLAEIASWLCASHSRLDLGQTLPAPPALWWMDAVGMQAFEPHFYIDITAHVELKERMLACHASQLERAGDGDFTSLPELMRNQYQTRGRQAGVAAAEAFRCYHAFKRSRAW